MAKKKTKAATKNKPPMIAIQAPIKITAAEGDSDDKGPPSFDVVAYTGGAIDLAYWDAPMVVDLKGITLGKSLVANLDHEVSQRVGHVTATDKADGKLSLSGKVSAATDAAREVVESAAKGFIWQASIEASPDEITEIKAGKKVTVNGRDFTGPLYVAAKSTLKGFAFVSHGADDDTTVKIAASAASTRSPEMDPQVQAWIEAMGFDVDELSEEQTEGLTADYNGRQQKTKKKTPLGKGFDARESEKERVDKITETALDHCDRRPHDMKAIRDLAERAIECKWGFDKFRLELLEASLPQQQSVFITRRDERLNDQVLQAAICQTGRLDGHEEMFNDQTLQSAHDQFPHGIGLKQLLLLGAEANGYRGNRSTDVGIEVQRAAFGQIGPQRIEAGGFSTLSIPNVVAATANKFLHEGWMAVDLTPLRIAFIRSVSDFKQITTVSLTGDLVFTELGTGGEIKHGKLSDQTYTNKAATYARMLSITRTDIINDDLSALTATPRRLGRGGALKLNNIFWAEFLDNTDFFKSANSNVSTVDGTVSNDGLSQAEVIFMSQTDPDGQPLGVIPKIILVPTAKHTTARQLMESEKLGRDDEGPTNNIWAGRFRVESSPYLHNTAYTGYSAVAWYMLADPNEMPVIEIVALGGRVEPVVESADADFNVLGIQMRGYSDIGVAKQEYRGGVRADGSAA